MPSTSPRLLATSEFSASPLHHEIIWDYSTSVASLPPDHTLNQYKAHKKLLSMEFDRDLKECLPEVVMIADSYILSPILLHKNYHEV